MRRAPIKPKRSWEVIIFEKDENAKNVTIPDVIKFFNGFGVNIEDIYINYDYCSSDGANFDGVYFTANVEESAEHYQERLDEYEVKLNEYKQWEAENADKIKDKKR